MKPCFYCIKKEMHNKICVRVSLLYINKKIMGTFHMDMLRLLLNNKNYNH